LPVAPAFSVRSTLGPFDFFALPPGASIRPPSIHFLIVRISASEIFGFFGGIFGSVRWAMTLKSTLLAESPAAATSPDPPPAIVAE
jgi:hypothetical protein